MKIPSKDVPQADVLSDVIKVVVLTSQGKNTYQKMSKGILKSERQGRYYRRAAELLGFIETKRNKSSLTALGKQFIDSGANLGNPILLKSILKMRVVQRTIAFLDNFPKGVTRDKITTYLTDIIEETGDSMLPRRAPSILSWLQIVGLIKQENRSFKLIKLINRVLPILDFTDSDEPILPKSGKLSEYQTVADRFSIAKDEIISYMNVAKMERASNSHRHLVNLVASRIRRAGSLPRSNQIIDLAARINNQDYIFEMKSTTPNNVKSQIRKGLSQLYEYRYIQNLSNATLILVLESKLPLKIDWFREYLGKDRGIMLIWDGDEKLYSDDYTKKELSFLW